VLWGLAACLAIFPLFTVNTTSWGMRLLWIGALAMGGFIGFMAHMREETDSELHKYAELQRKGPFVRRYRPIVIAIILGALLIAELLSVAATYATPDRPFLWHGTMLITQWGDSIFPLIGKYATRMTPPLDTETMYKTQAVTTLFLTAGALAFITYAPYVILMPHEETQVMHRVSDLTGPHRFLSSPGMMLVTAPIAILLGLTLFFGWLEFSSASGHGRKEYCVLTAACYARDDLMLIASGFLRVFGSYGFWLAGIMIVKKEVTAEPS
jgi:hypothetical protein